MGNYRQCGPWHDRSGGLVLVIILLIAALAVIGLGGLVTWPA